MIEALAVELATADPAMIRTLIGAEHHDHGGLFFQALGPIPVLTGSWRHRGGGLARSVGSWSELLVDDSVFAVPSSARSLNMNHVGRALVDPQMSIYAMFIWNGNPLVSTPNAGQFLQGLEREDLFCAVSEQFMTDTARYADVIFPAAPAPVATAPSLVGGLVKAFDKARQVDPLYLAGMAIMLYNTLMTIRIGKAVDAEIPQVAAAHA